MKLDCIYTRPESATSQSFDFYFNGQMILSTNNQGFSLSTTRQVKSNMEQSTLTLTKNVTGMVDAGEYLCKTENSIHESRITVHIFKMMLEGDIYKDGVTSLNVQCKPEGVNPTDTVLISWSRDGQILSNDDKYKIHAENSTLEILTAGRDDMGQYFCEVVFSPGTSEEQIVKPPAIEVKAAPAIDSHSKSKNMVQGEQLDLWCKVTGYPCPTLEWFKDGKSFNTTTRIHILEENSDTSKARECPTGKLTIYTLEFEDKGEYSCKASSPDFNTTATATMVIRVKDKLAALWPFLGIVAEVIVLCTIILIYEKKKSKQMQDEDDSPDANEDEKKDHKDVRHRRT